MDKFFGVFKYEYFMSIRRKSFLIILLLFTAFYVFLWLDVGSDVARDSNFNQGLLSEAGQMIFFLNLFYPVIAGILAADRLVRDQKLGVQEILRSTGIKHTSYTLGKYFGIVLSLVTIELLIVLSISVPITIINSWPITFIIYSLYAVLLLSGPGICFISAFSLACPMIMPLRVYQILFTGYWFWGNYLSPQVLPTISDTLLNASGKYSLQAFFGVQISMDSPLVDPIQAISNIGVLLLSAALALVVLIVYLGQSERKI